MSIDQIVDLFQSAAIILLAFALAGGRK